MLRRVTLEPHFEMDYVFDQSLVYKMKSDGRCIRKLKLVNKLSKHCQISDSFSGHFDDSSYFNETHLTSPNLKSRPFNPKTSNQIIKLKHSVPDQLKDESSTKLRREHTRSPVCYFSYCHLYTTRKESDPNSERSARSVHKQYVYCGEVQSQRSENGMHGMQQCNYRMSPCINQEKHSDGHHSKTVHMPEGKGYLSLLLLRFDNFPRRPRTGEREYAKIKRESQAIKDKMQRTARINPYTHEQYLYFRNLKTVEKHKEVNPNITKPCSIRSLPLSSRDELNEAYERRKKEQQKDYNYLLSRMKKKPIDTSTNGFKLPRKYELFNGRWHQGDQEYNMTSKGISQYRATRTYFKGFKASNSHPQMCENIEDRLYVKPWDMYQMPSELI